MLYRENNHQTTLARSVPVPVSVLYHCIVFFLMDFDCILDILVKTIAMLHNLI